MAVSIVFRLRARKNKQNPPGMAVDDSEQSLESWVIRVTHPDVVNATIHDLQQRGYLPVSFARIKRQGQLSIVTDETKLERDDLVSIVGHRSCLEAAVQLLGERSHDRLDLDRSRIDFRRIFVSQKSVTEVPLHTLRIGSKFGAAITRVRRGDVDIVADGNTVLEPGDRVRVVAPRERMDEIAKFLGDSYKALSEIDVITFSIGLALGLLLGKVPLPLPGGGHFELGFAGGPLIVGLILGRLGRTGPFVWTLPFSANLTLRQLGMVLFLAGIGTRSGHSFAETLHQGGGILPLMIGGAVVTCLVAMSMIFVGHYLLKIPAPLLAGMLAGAQTQPAVLAFAAEQAGDESPNRGYATVYPLAMIAKIVLAQLMLV
jgi:putative transport protein